MIDLVLFIPATALLLLTPGPTNTLLALSGAQSGVRRSLQLIPAELAGYLLAIAAWGFALASAGDVLPWLPPVLRIAAALYLLILAMRLWRIAPNTMGRSAVSPGRLFMTTLLNPKALIFAGGIFPIASFADPLTFVFAFGVFTATLLPVAVAWIVLGASLRGGIGQGIAARRGVALLLVLFAVWLGRSGVTAA